MSMTRWLRGPCGKPARRILACLAFACGLAGCATTPRTHAPLPANASSARLAPAATGQSPVARPPHAIPAGSAATLAQRIDVFIAQPRFAAATWGINVVALDTGRVVYAHNAGKLAIPASNTKLYTAALALATLGGDDRIQTSLYATAAPHDGVINGDLVLYGRGDPTLGGGNDTQTPLDWADAMANALAKRGITRIQGDIIADDTYFSGPRIGPGWEALDLQNWYVPPASALTVQGNMFTLEVAPDHGACCRISTTPAETGVDIVNLARLSADATRDDLGLFRPPGSPLLFVYGAVRPDAGARNFALAAPDPAYMAGELLLEGLARHGIQVDGAVRPLHWPRNDAALDAPGRVELASIASPTLQAIIHHALKHSDNLYAQLLLLQVGVAFERGGACPDRERAPDTTLGWALCAMRAFLARVGIDHGAALIGEGSGLSRKDLVTPRATTTLLAWAARQPFAASFRDALPVAGIDGTLERRMVGTLASGNVQAKTGTLRYSYTLSGYVTTAGGVPLAFSLMLEDYAQPVDGRGTAVDPSPEHDLDALAEMLAGIGAPAAASSAQ